jgi:hypothetical protein
MLEAGGGIAGSLISALLTVMVLSYLLGDNPLFRVATYIFIGVAAGYAGAVAWHSVIWPRLLAPFFELGFGALTNLGLIASWLLFILLLFKASSVTSRVGNISLALMVGVGASIVVGGAITGTLIPQTMASIETLDPRVISPRTGEASFERVLNVLVIMTGTISTLLYFTFTVPESADEEPERPLALKIVASLGKAFIMITFGVMYAGALMAAVVVFADRVQFLRDVVVGLAGG